MIRRLPHLVLVWLAVAALLAPTALAGGGNPKKKHKHPSGCVSAVCVYHEGWQSASGTVGGPNGGAFTALPPAAVAALARDGGKDTRVLTAVGTYGAQRPLPAAAAATADVGAPSGFLAALDLGPGPIALFVVLLAGAAAFAVGGVLRRRRGLGN